MAMASEHYERRRYDARLLSEFAAERGLTMSVERTYRAWVRHSESMCAGWMIHDMEGPEADITFQILASEAERLDERDAALLYEQATSVDDLHARAEAEGMGLSREDVTRIWADHSATLGVEWEEPEPSEIDRVLQPHRVQPSTGYSF